jgi:hypothetical protein|tara:strand:- start:1156 stop:1449 length:294 start_codon:yes stop_codon:yes gene_type:complete
MTEGSLQRYFKSACKAEGILWRKIRFEGQRGCPDVMIAYGGKVVLVELKNPNKQGRLSEIQVRQIAKFKQVGIKVHVVDNKEQINNVIREIVNTRTG